MAQVQEFAAFAWAEPAAEVYKNEIETVESEHDVVWRATLEGFGVGGSMAEAVESVANC